jgi:prepilin-type processing-associated H-X9-DG protein
MLGQVEYTGFTTAVTPNSFIADCGTESGDGAGVFAARSYHPGGVHAAMADGSVRSVANGVNPQVWRALGTRAKGELVSGEMY